MKAKNIFSGAVIGSVLTYHLYMGNLPFLGSFSSSLFGAAIMATIVTTVVVTIVLKLTEDKPTQQAREAPLQPPPQAPQAPFPNVEPSAPPLEQILADTPEHDNPPRPQVVNNYVYPVVPVIEKTPIINLNLNRNPIMDFNRTTRDQAALMGSTTRTSQTGPSSFRAANQPTTAGSTTTSQTGPSSFRAANQPTTAGSTTTSQTGPSSFRAANQPSTARSTTSPSQVQLPSVLAPAPIYRPSVTVDTSTRTTTTTTGPSTFRPANNTAGRPPSSPADKSSSSSSSTTYTTGPSTFRPV